MTTPLFDDMPAPVMAALDRVQADLTESGTLEPAERDLADDVRRYLLPRVRDPLSRALVERPEIVAWCVHRALRRGEPAPRSGDPGFYRRAEPLPEPPAGGSSDPGETPPASPGRTTRRTRGAGAGRKS
jgi:hypothetical protein